MLAMGAKLVLTGLAVGLGASLLLARYLKSEVFQVPATDPRSLIGVALLLRRGVPGVPDSGTPRGPPGPRPRLAARLERPCLQRPSVVIW